MAQSGAKMKNLRTLFANLLVLLVLSGLAGTPALSRGISGDCSADAGALSVVHAQMAVLHHGEAGTSVSGNAQDGDLQLCCMDGCVASAALLTLESTPGAPAVAPSHDLAGEDIVAASAPEGLIRPPRI